MILAIVSSNSHQNVRRILGPENEARIDHFECGASEAVATLLVASQMGIWGTGKSSQEGALMRAASEAVCDYLERLRP